MLHLLSDKNTCSRCGSTLVPRGHWKLCPVHEPQFFTHIPEGYALVQKPSLLGKGTPQDRQS